MWAAYATGITCLGVEQSAHRSAAMDWSELTKLAMITTQSNMMDALPTARCNTTTNVWGSRAIAHRPSSWSALWYPFRKVDATALRWRPNCKAISPKMFSNTYSSKTPPSKLLKCKCSNKRDRSWISLESTHRIWLTKLSSLSSLRGTHSLSCTTQHCHLCIIWRTNAKRMSSWKD